MKTAVIICFIMFSLNFLAVLSQSEYSVRLRGSSHGNRGTVEIYLQSRSTLRFTWGTLCDNFWDIKDANVVCRQLGYSHATAARHNSYYGQGTVRTIWVHRFHCNGSESSLSECPSNSGSRLSCDESQAAGVDCYTEAETDSSLPPSAYAAGFAIGTIVVIGIVVNLVICGYKSFSARAKQTRANAPVGVTVQPPIATVSYPVSKQPHV